MEAYAVIQTGGKQYMVKKGEVLEIEKLEGEKGASVEIKNVLALHDGTTLKVGAPELAGAAVKAEIMDQKLAPKVVSFKKKRRKGYSRKVGHRQEFTVIKIAELA
ncbi:MAG: 50S ribosomal protein L21 [Kiritimatiellia bacterium]